MVKKPNLSTNELVRLSVFVALIIIQSWVPMLGYINIPPLAITYIHVTVIVATLWLGVKQGMLVGAAWGLNSWLKAILAPVSPINTLVLSSPLVSVLPRILMPLILGTIVYYLKQKQVNSKLVGLTAGVLGSWLNTFLVLGAIVIFKQQAYMDIKSISDQATLWQVLGGIIATNGVFESIAAGIITPILYTVTLQFDKRKRS